MFLILPSKMTPCLKLIVEVVYVPMSYFEDGRTGYPVRYMKKDEIIVDILRQYDRFTKLVSDKKHKLFIFDTED